jgi:ATP-dependent exoDNAse (exonuclease V) alpha subunit
MALHRLVVDARTYDAPTRDAALDEMVRDWAADRATQERTVCMISEDHRTRRALIARARAHLSANGELTGERLTAGGQEFQAGDEVIARAPARHLHPPGASDRFVRNGTTGRVTAVRTAADSGQAGMWVDFVGRGEIFVADSDLNGTIRPGVTGVLTHSYALTSHAAQGATFDVSRTFASPGTSPAGLYVAVSRARDDLRVYTAPEARVAPNGDERVVRDHGPGLSAVAVALRDRGDDVLAIERDPTLVARADSEATPVPAVSALPAVAVADVAGLELSL